MTSMLFIRAVALMQFALLLPAVHAQRSFDEPLRTGLDFRIQGAAGAAADNRVSDAVYHGGQVMTSPAKLYYIYYGNWAADPVAVSILNHFANNFGNSPWYSIVTDYHDAAGTRISPNVTFGAAISDSYSQGMTLGRQQVINIVNRAITVGGLPRDGNGIYFVLTAADVVENSGFCGWHDHADFGAQNLKFSFVGNKANQGLAGCAGQTDSSPNGHPAADAMVNVLAHEIMETVTDPQFTAWYDPQGREVSDKCEWHFGATYTAANGSFANMVLGGKDYLIQETWVHQNGGYCALSQTVPYLSAVNPSFGSVGLTTNVTLSGFNLQGAKISPVEGLTFTNEFATPSGVSAAMTIAPGAATGTRLLRITTAPPGASGAFLASRTSNSVQFQVTAAAPALTDITPSSAVPGASVQVVMNGTNLVGAAINIGLGIAVRNLVATATQVSALLVIPGNTLPGLIPVSVTTAGGTSNQLTFTLAGIAGPPTLTSVSPNAGPLGGAVDVLLTGTNFTSPAVIAMSDPGIIATNVEVLSGSLIKATFVIAGSANRRYFFTVGTAGGISSGLSFDVQPGAPGQLPVLTGISPSSGTPGSVNPVVLTGANLTGASFVPVSGVTISNVVATASQISAVFAVHSGAALGARNVMVSTSTGASNALAFTVTSNAPVLTTITPPNATPGSVVLVTIIGANLIGSTLGTMQGISFSYTSVTATQINATLTIAAGAVLGQRNVTVTNANGTSNSLPFTITGSGPAINSINTTSARQGAALMILVSGTNLTGATIHPIPGVTITGTVSTANSVSALFEIGQNAPLGPVNLTVSTGAGTSAPIGFTITPLRDVRF